MSVNDKALLKPSAVHVYFAPADTPRPTTYAELKAPKSPWVEVGHTTADNLVDFQYEGGERATLATAQKAAARESVSDIIESFGVNLLEWTKDSAELYYGSNVRLLADGAVEIPSKPVPKEGALLVILEDGEDIAGFYAAKASAFRNSAIAASDMNSLAQLPVKFTGLQADGKDSAITLIPKRAKTDPEPDGAGA